MAKGLQGPGDSVSKGKGGESIHGYKRCQKITWVLSIVRPDQPIQDPKMGPQKNCEGLASRTLVTL